LASVGALQDPVRRALYLHVVEQGRSVSRIEAAEAVGVRRRLATFHLDRLAADGLLEVECRRLTGRTGPGAGRPVTLPPRSYAFAAELLAVGVEEVRPGGSGDSPEEIARRHGEGMGSAMRSELVARPSPAQLRRALVRVLASYGYQPYPDGKVVRLRNCPCHALADRHTELVCGMNRAMLEGVLTGLGVAGMNALLEPATGQCCVVLGPTRRIRAAG